MGNIEIDYGVICIYIFISNKFHYYDSPPFQRTTTRGFVQQSRLTFSSNRSCKEAALAARVMFSSW